MNIFGVTEFAARLPNAVCGILTLIIVFLMADAVSCGKKGQKVPQGFYNLELMLKSVIRNGQVLLCGTCMDARGLTDEELIDGAQRSSMKELSERTLNADKVLVF